MSRTSVIAGIILRAGLLPLATGAAPAIDLTSVALDLPVGDRTFPPGPGADAANNNCLACHSAGMVLNQPALSKAAWAAEVDKMIHSYKAPVAAKDIDAIDDYLASLRGGK